VSAHVLVAEDDEMQAEVIKRYLEHDGHTATVVHDGHAAIEQVRRGRPDLVVLDLMMPGIDGLEVCRTLRRESDVPVLMLTARSTEDDMLLGLDIGADDYLIKPYSPRELTARVRTLLRRAARTAAPDQAVLRVGALVVDEERRQVRLAGRPVDCTRGEFELLAAMVAQPGRVFTREQLVERTSYAFDRYPTLRTVDVHIRNLRRKIEADPGRPAYLLTVFGVGYKIGQPDAR
jgi:DNA-binding response OmpR family regulator